MVNKKGPASMVMMNSATISRSAQFYHENKTWSRSLEFFKQENNYLKNRLAEVVDHKTGKDFLALAEQFQNRFIIKDEYIDELDHDVNAQMRMLKENLNNDSGTDEKLNKRQNKLRNEMEYLERNFAELKNGFNKYLSSVL